MTFSIYASIFRLWVIYKRHPHRGGGEGYVKSGQMWTWGRGDLSYSGRPQTVPFLCDSLAYICLTLLFQEIAQKRAKLALFYGMNLVLPITFDFYMLQNMLVLTIVHINTLYLLTIIHCAFSALTLLVGRQEGHPACKKTEWWGTGVVICLERGADLHMA